MGNMSYCRFENTASDLDDCKGALERLLRGEKEERGEEVQLSERELKKAKELALTCLEILIMIQEEGDFNGINEMDELDIEGVLDTAQHEAYELDLKAADAEEE